ncbi:hypothetical protein SFUMM280S_03331 [Streptomyces fumanus]
MTASAASSTRTPDGTLCSNNLSRNSSLDKPGQWKTTNVSNNFWVPLYDQASHGADYFKVYVSKQGFDPKTQTLGWGNLDFITQTGRYAPAQHHVPRPDLRLHRTPHPVRDLASISTWTRRTCGGATWTLRLSRTAPHAAPATARHR